MEQTLIRKAHSNMALDPITCHCRRCHQTWTTREKKPGQGHREPPRCSKDGCKSNYWRTLPEISYEPDFDPFITMTTQKKLVFEGQNGFCRKCFISWAKEVGFSNEDIDAMLETRIFMKEARKVK